MYSLLCQAGNMYLVYLSVNLSTYSYSKTIDTIFLLDLSEDSFVVTTWTPLTVHFTYFHCERGLRWQELAV